MGAPAKPADTGSSGVHVEGFTLHIGDVRQQLKLLADGSADCCVTSPPYFGLREYQSDQQIGLEATPEEYIDTLVEVFEEVRRVLAPHGVLFLNLGDSYNNRSVARKSSHQTGLGFDSNDLQKTWVEYKAEGRTRMSIKNGDLKEKDMLGIPWMAAFALRKSGWYLRSEIIWDKVAMPESVKDRPTKSHEQIFMLTKSPRYFFNQEAVRESGNGSEPGGNVRTVWRIPTEPYPGAHFATFPAKLASRCIEAGCPTLVCTTCGAPRTATPTLDEPDCGHPTSRKGVVLDPFIGSGTTAACALRLGREAVGIELNRDYLPLIEQRVGRWWAEAARPMDEPQIEKLF